MLKNFSKVCFNLGSLSGTLMLSFSAAHPREGHQLPGLYGTDEYCAGAGRVLQPGV